MRWRLRDGSREIWIVDAFWDRENAPGRALSASEGALLLRAAAADPFNAGTLRQLRAPRAGLGTDDTFEAFNDPVAATIADVFAGKLIVLVVAEPVASTQEPASEHLEPEPDEAQPLVATPEPEPVVTADVLAQIAALQRASEIGAPFCEE